MYANLNRCLTRDDLSRLLGVSTRTVRRMDRDGTSPRSIRPSSRVNRYPAAEIAEFISANRLDSSPEVRSAPDGAAPYDLA